MNIEYIKYIPLFFLCFLGYLVLVGISVFLMNSKSIIKVILDKINLLLAHVFYFCFIGAITFWILSFIGIPEVAWILLSILFLWQVLCFISTFFCHCFDCQHFFDGGIPNPHGEAHPMECNHFIGNPLSFHGGACCFFKRKK